MIFFARQLRAHEHSVVSSAYLLNWRGFRKVIIKRFSAVSSNERAALELLASSANALPSFVPKLLPSLCSEGQLVYRFINGVPLHRYYSVLLQQSDETKFLFFKKILAMVAFLHNHSTEIIHNDLSPANILVDKYGRLFLIDFGDVNFTGANHAVLSGGKPHYASPEQRLGLVTTKSSDIYQLGCILFDILHGTQYQDREDIPVMAFADIAWKSIEFQQIAERFLSEDPLLRYQTVSDCETAIDALLVSGIL